MLRFLLAFLSGLAITGTAPADDTAAKVSIRWHGQSFFEIESSKGTRIAIDPHALEAYGRKEISADLILVSHLHNDHSQIGVIKNHTKAKVLWGLTGTGKKTTWNNIDLPFRDLHIHTVGVYHDDMEGLERGKNTIFIIEVDGLRIVHLGDLGHLLSEKDVKRIGRVDILMIPVGGVYTINGSDAKKVVDQLKPRQYILPMHYGTKVFDDVLPPDEFLEEQKNVRRYPSNKLTIASDFKAAEPIIAMLDWKN